MNRLLARVIACASLILAFAGARAPALAQGPGSPPAGTSYTLKVRENFTIPAQQEPGAPTATQTPVPVAPGVVVLKDDPNQPNQASDFWSDVLYFTTQDPNHRTALFLSDPEGRPFSDADLAPLGLTINQINADPRTVYVNETLPFTGYHAGGGSGFGNAVYQVYSDQDTLPPGAPIGAQGGQSFQLAIRENCGEVNPEPASTVNLPAPCQPGFLVLLDKGSPTNEADTHNSANWSDVVYFRAGAAPFATQALLISDSHAPGTPENGIQNSDLSPYGISVFDVIEGNTVFVRETQPVNYSAVDPTFGLTAAYKVYSDADGIVISTVGWTTIGSSVRFQVRVENPDVNCPSNPVHLVTSSQPFGLFLQNYGPIGTMDVPSIPPSPEGGPNSFFDVFFEVPLTQLPPSAQKTWPMVTIGPGATPLASHGNGGAVQSGGGCPPDNHWDGNVDIVWSDPATGDAGHVNKHFGTLQVCPAHGSSYIHLITGCSSTSTVSITGVCPGWTVTLTNNDGSPAPSPLPAGWDGKISVSADASIPTGATCCFSVVVLCGGETGTIDMCATACQCQTTGPSPTPSTIDWTTMPGNIVEFHVRWTDPDPNLATQPVSGDMSSQMFGVFLPDAGPIGHFDVPPISPTSFFDVFIDVPLTQLPPTAPQRVPGSGGAQGPCPPENHWDGNVDIVWNGNGGGGQVNKHIGHIKVCPGGGNSYIHMISGCTVAVGGTWSIVGLCPGFNATLVNEDLTPAPNPVPPNWTGFIVVSAAAATPVPTTCCFDVKFACGGAIANIELCATTCDCQHPTVNPVPSTIDWANAAGGKVRFHVRWTDPDPNVATSEISGDMMSQDFGIFLRDFGPIGHFTVPPIMPNSFFDVFTEVDLSQLPPQPPKTTPGINPTGGNCPPDTTWNGNVDIEWTGPGGAGTSHKHVGTVLVNRGVAPSFVHVLTGCPAAAGLTWSIAIGCPGWTATLVNQDLSPAPSHLPPGWTGWISVSASASAVPVCCFTINFTCGNSTGAIDLCAAACQWNPTDVIGGPTVTFGIRDLIPNPSFGQTLIRYALPVAGPVKLEVFDAAGHRVRTVFNGVQAAGVSTLTWDGRNDRGDAARPGTYFVRLAQEGKTATRKLQLRP